MKKKTVEFLIFIFLFFLVVAQRIDALTVLNTADLIAVDTQTRGVEYYIKLPATVKYKIYETTDDLKLTIDFIDCKWDNLKKNNLLIINISPVKSATFIQFTPNIARITFDLYFNCVFAIESDEKFEERNFLKLDILLNNKEKSAALSAEDKIEFLAATAADTFQQILTVELEEIIFADGIFSENFISLDFPEPDTIPVAAPVVKPPVIESTPVKEPEITRPAFQEDNEQDLQESVPVQQPQSVKEEIVTIVKEEIEYVYSSEEVFYPATSQEPFFSIMISPPKLPISISAPARNSVVNTLTPDFSWNPIESTNYYQLFLARHPLTENSVIMIKNTSANNYKFDAVDAVESLINNGKYAWFVVAFNDNNEIISLQQPNDYAVFDIKIEEKKVEPQIYEQPDTVIQNQNIVTTDTKTEELPKKKIEISLSNLRFNNKLVEVYEREVTLTKDDVENGIFIITGTLTGADGVKVFQFSADGGSSFNNIAFLKQSQPYQFNYSFKPQDSVEYKFSIKITDIEDNTISENYFGQMEKIKYINKTTNDLIKDLLSDFCKAYQTNDRTLFMKCISQSFIGNNAGYEDYTAIESSIRTVFNKTATFICLYQNERINILSPTRAQVDFIFKRNFKFDDIDRTRQLEINASFDLIKENESWKILTDKSKLIFMKHYPDIPSTPY